MVNRNVLIILLKPNTILYWHSNNKIISIYANLHLVAAVKWKQNGHKFINMQNMIMLYSMTTSAVPCAVRSLVYSLIKSDQYNLQGHSSMIPYIYV